MSERYVNVWEKFLRASPIEPIFSTYNPATQEGEHRAEQRVIGGTPGNSNRIILAPLS